MAISLDEALDLASRYHQLHKEGGSADDARALFVHPPQAMIYVLQGEDITLEGNSELHKRFSGERFTPIPMEQWTITQLSEAPERARVVGAILWQAQLVDSPDKLIEAIVGEDWIVQRGQDGKVRFALYINTYHHLLPGSAPTGLYESG
jgi:hypothetical protein